MLSITSAIIVEHVKSAGGRLVKKGEQPTKGVPQYDFVMNDRSSMMIGRFTFPNREAADTACAGINRFSARPWSLSKVALPEAQGLRKKKNNK